MRSRKAPGGSKPSPRVCVLGGTQIGKRLDCYSSDVGVRSPPVQLSIGCIMSYAYKKIKLSDGSTRDEHRLIMENHLGRSLLTNEHIHHKDGNKRNNEISNLMLISSSDHAKTHLIGVSKSDDVKQKIKDTLTGKYVGENSFRNILVDSDVIEIKHMLLKGIKHRIIAEKFNVNVRTISHINVGRRWSHIKI